MRNSTMSRSALSASLFLVPLLLVIGTPLRGASARDDGKSPASPPVAPAPRLVLVKVRLVKVERLPDGTTKEETLQAPTLSTADGHPGQIGVTSENKAAGTFWETQTRVLPHLNADGSITLQLETWDTNARGAEDITTSSVKATRRLQPGKAARIRGLQMAGEPVEVVVTASEITDKPATP